MKIQTKYMQTILDDYTGKFLYYRVTFPISKEFACSGILKNHAILQIKNRYFYVNESTNFELLEKVVIKLQIKIAEYNISLLKKKIINKQIQLFL